MYPQVESPTSPDDQPMEEMLPDTNMTEIVVDIQQPKAIINDNPEKQLEKSSDTLRNNIDIKDEINKKRTSFKIENAAMVLLMMDTVDKNSIKIGKQNKTINDDVINNVSSNITTDNNDSILFHNNDNTLINDNFNIIDTADDHNKIIMFNNNTVIDRDSTNNINIVNNRYRRATLATHDDDDDDDEDDYNDMENGNSTDSTRKRDSMTSRESSDDYFLCEQFKNALNGNLRKKLRDDVDSAITSLELMSPNEGPLAKRYAEIAPYNR